MTVPTRDTIEAEILELIREFSTARDVTVDADTTFDTAGVSSLDVLQIVFRLEEAHGIEIDTSTFYRVRTIGDIVAYVHTAIGGRDG